MAAESRRYAWQQGRERRRRTARIATLGLALAVLTGLLGLAAGPGYRFGALPLGIAFNLIRWSAYGGMAAGVLCLAGMVIARPGGPRRGFYRALAGLVLSLVVVGVPWSYQRAASSVPPIHDITTDPQGPPHFLAVRSLRVDAPNRAEYGGAEVAAQQREAYPDLEPARLELPPDEAFRRALRAAQAMDWKIVIADQSAGRIEATDRSFWFGFRDDVVIRVRAADSGSVVDVRSASRVGQSDLGVNAARIRSYLETLERTATG